MQSPVLFELLRRNNSEESHTESLGEWKMATEDGGGMKKGSVGLEEETANKSMSILKDTESCRRFSRRE